MDVRLLTSQLFRMVSERGVATTCRNVLNHLGSRRHRDAFDVRNGTDTGGLRALWNLDIASPNIRHGERYQATTEAELAAALTALPGPFTSATFIDLGCGKGRTLLVAARLGFAALIGVEFARELVEVAKRNLVVAGVTNGRVVHADAADFAFPGGDLVLYLYNPFSEAVLGQVLTNLRRRAGGCVHIVYKTPRCSGSIDATGAYERLDSPVGAPHIAIWRTRRVADSRE